MKRLINGDKIQQIYKLEGENLEDKLKDKFVIHTQEDDLLIADKNTSDIWYAQSVNGELSLNEANKIDSHHVSDIDLDSNLNMLGLQMVSDSLKQRIQAGSVFLSSKLLKQIDARLDKKLDELYPTFRADEYKKQITSIIKDDTSEIKSINLDDLMHMASNYMPKKRSFEVCGREPHARVMIGNDGFNMDYFVWLTDKLVNRPENESITKTLKDFDKKIDDLKLITKVNTRRLLKHLSIDEMDKRAKQQMFKMGDTYVKFHNDDNLPKSGYAKGYFNLKKKMRSYRDQVKDFSLRTIKKLKEKDFKESYLSNLRDVINQSNRLLPYEPEKFLEYYRNKRKLINEKKQRKADELIECNGSEERTPKKSFFSRIKDNLTKKATGFYSAIKDRFSKKYIYKHTLENDETLEDLASKLGVEDKESFEDEFKNKYGNTVSIDNVLAKKYKIGKEKLKEVCNNGVAKDYKSEKISDYFLKGYSPEIISMKLRKEKVKTDKTEIEDILKEQKQNGRKTRFSKIFMTEEMGKFVSDMYNNTDKSLYDQRKEFAQKFGFIDKDNNPLVSSYTIYTIKDRYEREHYGFISRKQPTFAPRLKDGSLCK